MSILEDTIAQSDASWFYNNGFIPYETYQKVIDWLNGKYDPDIQLIIALWFERDVTWIGEVESSAMIHFWYVSPIVKLQATILKSMLLKRAKELRAGALP